VKSRPILPQLHFLAAVVARWIVLLIAQMIAQLGVHRPFQQPLHQALQQSVSPITSSGFS